MKKAENILIFLFPAAAAVIAMLSGRFAVTPGDIFALVSGGEVKDTVRTVMLNIRLPRIILAFLCGGGLSAAGAAMQSLFSNPLAAPDTIGVSGGASFGAALAMLLGFPAVAVQFSALAWGVAVCFYVLLLSSKDKGIMGTVLAGMVISSVFQALVSAVKFIADPTDTLPAITFWLMGSMSRAGWDGIITGAPLMIIAAAVLIAMRWRINLLMLSDDEAGSLGTDPRRLRVIVMICVSVISASAVSMCGLVGWVGLLVPHMVRAVVGSDNSSVLPACIFAGGGLMILTDTLARCVTASEIPISIITALLGAPVFLAVMRKMRYGD